MSTTQSALAGIRGASFKGVATKADGTRIDFDVLTATEWVPRVDDQGQPVLDESGSPIVDQIDTEQSGTAVVTYPDGRVESITVDEFNRRQLEGWNG